MIGRDARRLCVRPILDGTIDRDQRDKFLDEVNAAFARLRADPDAWKEELAERRLDSWMDWKTNERFPALAW